VPELDRRDALKLIAAGGASALVVACARPRGRDGGPDPVIAVQALPPSPSPWPTLDPFLFCVHHDDHYPAGNEGFGPAAPLAGRRASSHPRARATRVAALAGKLTSRPWAPPGPATRCCVHELPRV
jgi:hypothetical protein